MCIKSYHLIIHPNVFFSLSLSLLLNPIKMVCVCTHESMNAWHSFFFSIAIFPNDSLSGLHILRADDDGREPLLKIFQIVLTTPKIPFCWQPAGFIESYPVTTYTPRPLCIPRESTWEKEEKQCPESLARTATQEQGRKRMETARVPTKNGSYVYCFNMLLKIIIGWFGLWQ